MQGKNFRAHESIAGSKNIYIPKEILNIIDSRILESKNLDVLIKEDVEYEPKTKLVLNTHTEICMSDFIKTYCDLNLLKSIKASIFMNTYNKITGNNLSAQRAGVTIKEMCKIYPIHKKVRSDATYYVGISFNQSALDIMDV